MRIFDSYVVFKYFIFLLLVIQYIIESLWIIEKQFWRHLTNVWRVFLYAWIRWRQSFTDTFSIYSIIFGRWIDIGIGNFALTLSGGISTMNPSSAVTVFTLLQFWYGTFDVLFACKTCITVGSRQGSLAKPLLALSILFLTPRAVTPSHQHRTLVCLFSSGNIQQSNVSNSSNHSFSNT